MTTIPMKASIRVMLIEDNQEFREVIALALAEIRDLDLADLLGSAEGALNRLADGAKPPPDVILLDLRLPGMSGHEALPYIRKYSPGTKIVILSQSDAEADVLRAISLGASGYLLKSATAQEIVEGIRAVLAGGAALDPSIARYLLQACRRQYPRHALSIELSSREMEILTLLGDGLVKKQIADRLKIGYSTVDTHVSHIYEKLQVCNAPAAIGKAYRLGLFRDESGK